MKKLKKIGLFVMCLGIFTACNNKKVEKETLAVKIEGMTCEIGCAKMITSKLKQTDGILDAEIVFDKKTGNISFDKNKISQASILSLISNLGDGKTYKASTSFAKEKSCDSNKEMSCKPDCKKKCEKSAEGKKSCDSKKEMSCKPGCKKACCTVTKEAA